METNQPLTLLADPTRLAIFERLRGGPLAVVEIARDLPVSRPAVSQHLKVLKDAGLVADRQEGNRRIYQLEPAGVAALRDYFDQFWRQALAAYQWALEPRPEGDPMTQQSGLAPIRTSITVEAPIERAFEVFTAGFATWWPAAYHIGASEMQTALIEPREGGRWYERGVDGSECVWGAVKAWEPPHRLVLSWHINGQWQVDPDPARASEVEIRFTAESESRTRVDLVHHHFERHADGGEGFRQSLSGDQGWKGVLAAYAAKVQA